MKEFLKNRLFIASILGLIVLIGITQLVDDEDKHPCAPKQYPGRCYRVTREICLSTWNKYQDECSQKVSELNLSPSRITGPIVFNCQLAKFDRLFSYLRTTNPDCNEQQEELELWKKTNPDF